KFSEEDKAEVVRWCADFGRIWAAVPAGPGQPFRSNWAANPMHLGSESDAPGQRIRCTWAANPMHLGSVACDARRAASSVSGVASVTAPSPDAAPPDETNSRSSAPQTRARSQPPGDLRCNRPIQGVGRRIPTARRAGWYDVGGSCGTHRWRARAAAL